jgi:hypothetical protein
MLRFGVPVLLLAIGACASALTGPGPSQPCPPEHELVEGACVYRGGYLIPAVARPSDAGR